MKKHTLVFCLLVFAVIASGCVTNKNQGNQSSEIDRISNKSMSESLKNLLKDENTRGLDIRQKDGETEVKVKITLYTDKKLPEGYLSENFDSYQNVEVGYVDINKLADLAMEEDVRYVSEGNKLIVGEPHPDPVNSSKCSSAAQQVLETSPGPIHGCKTVELIDASLVEISSVSDCPAGCISSKTIFLVHQNGTVEPAKSIFSDSILGACPESLSMNASEAKKYFPMTLEEKKNHDYNQTLCKG